MDTMDTILQAVADGTVTPAQAAEQLGRLRALPVEPLSEEPAAELVPLRRILVKAGAARLTVVGDPDVAEAVAEGPHRMERDGDTLLVTTNMAEGEFTASAPRSDLLSWVTQLVDRAGASIVVRVNPDLPVQILIVGGALDVTGLRRGAAVGVEAAGAKLSDSSGPLQLEVISGSAKVDWTFTGESRIQVDMGSANVLVRPDSDVAVTAEASLGQAVLKTHTGIIKAVGDATTAPVPVGAGSGRLHAATRMGSVQMTFA
jgi:hypothetical protein